MQSLTIPRGQVVLAGGAAAADATAFEVSAKRGATDYGICSTPFLEYAFRTHSFRIQVTAHPDGTWSYVEDTVLMVKGQDEPFHHTDRNTLTLVAERRRIRSADKDREGHRRCQTLFAARGLASTQ